MSDAISMMDTLIAQEESYRYIKKLTLYKGEFIVSEFEKAKYFYWIEKGTAMVNIVQDQQEYISAFVVPGDICGIDSVSSAIVKKHSISVISKQMQCWRIDSQFLLHVCMGNARMMEIVFNQFGNVLQRHYDVFDIISLPLEERVYQALCYLGNTLGKQSSDGEVTLPSFVTQGVLARFCRTTQPHISKQLHRLAETGFVVRTTIPLRYLNN